MTLCGTPEYLAPEVIGHSGYDRMVDWWALGILTFELIFGETPFADDDEDAPPVVIFQNIKAGIEEVDFPIRSVDTVNFIKSLLKDSPGRRLGIGGKQQVISHPFFKDVDVNAVENGTATPPFIPKHVNNDPLSAIDQEEHELPPFVDYVDDGSEWDENF